MRPTYTTGIHLDDASAGLATDLYELTMAAGYVECDRMAPASFELFVRGLPEDRSYLVTAGLDQALHYLEELRFEAADVEWLRSLPEFRGVGPRFFEWLRDFRFSGTVDAMPEGTIAFSNQPLLRVTAPLPEAQLVETYLLSTVMHQTMIASKAARMVCAAEGRALFDFGTRRAHGPAAGVAAARAAWIAGFEGTSNVYAGRRLGIPVVGTMAHSWVMSFDTEREAFEAFARFFPDHTALLVDTYDVIEGCRRATRLGDSLRAVRIDSGDLASVSRRCREILDDAGLSATQVIASGDLDERRISDLVTQGAVNAFGVGTRLSTSDDAPSLSAVYKLIEREEGGRAVPVLKRSHDKETLPGSKQVWRVRDASGRFERDVIELASAGMPPTEASYPLEPLLHRVMTDGRVSAILPTLTEARVRCRASLAALPEHLRGLNPTLPYPVLLGSELQSLFRDLMARAA